MQTQELTPESLSGNRFSADRANGTASLLPSAVASAAYDAANEQTQFAGASLTYDANGNLTSDGVNTYQWDARNRLASPAGPAIFTYDPLGRRASKTINGASTQFAYDGNDIAAEIGGGTIGANYLRSLNIDEPFIRQTSAGNEHYHTDALGSSLTLSDASGASVATYGYEPFGKTASTGSSSNTLQYTGREEDGLGLYYYRARYYSPLLLRFISEDPIQFLGNDVMLYQYAGANPIMKSDPSGLLSPAGTVALGCITGGLGGAFGQRKPALGGLAGALLGCKLSFLITTIPGGLPGAVVGGVLGAATGALTAAVGSPGDPMAVLYNAMGGALGGAVGGAIGGVGGTVFGTAYGVAISQQLTTMQNSPFNLLP